MFDGERDSGTSYGGRPCIRTYLLINLYRLVRGARTALIERRGREGRGEGRTYIEGQVGIAPPKSALHTSFFRRAAKWPSVTRREINLVYG